MGLNYIDTAAVAIRQRVAPDLLPSAAPSALEDLFRVYALLALVKGAETTAEDVHDAWAVWTLQHGEDHRSVRPFTELDTETQEEDRPFLDAIRAACCELNSLRNG